jgi:large subunit ribosomal protein L18e
MGVDLKSGGRSVGHKHRTTPKSENVYVRLLHKLYSFLARRTDSGFDGVVAKRLQMSRSNRPPIGLARLVRYMSGKEKKIAVVVGSVTDDIRLDGSAIPTLRVCALRFTEGARARITKAGGTCLTFDQLALLAPTGTDTVLLRAKRTARTANKFFGTPGAPGSTTQPRVRSKGRKVRREWGGEEKRSARARAKRERPPVPVPPLPYPPLSPPPPTHTPPLPPLPCSSRRPAAAASLVASRFKFAPPPV